MIGHVLTIDVIGVAEKKSWAEYKNTGSQSRRSLPFSPLSRFSSSPSPSLFAPATQAKLLEPNECFAPLPLTSVVTLRSADEC